MPRPTSGLRLGIGMLAFAALLGACTDEKTSTTSLPTELNRPSFAISVSSSNFQQCANGGDGGEPCFYINGVLNDSKSLYHESEVIAERFVIPGLTVGHTYRLAFDYGWEKALNPGHMNYDFLAGWDVTLGALANPCGNPLGNSSADIRGVCNADNTIKGTHSGANASFQVVPDAIFTTNAPLGLGTELQAAIDRFQTAHGANSVRFDILGGSFPANAYDNVTYFVSGDDVKGRFTVRFTAAQTTVMLLWGGHFADSRDYNLAVWDADKNAQTAEVQGNLTGAAGQSGAPFQFSQQYIKNLNSGDSTGIGSLSNNIQGSVLEPQPKAKISIVQSATNGIGESHTFTVTLQKDLDDGAGYIAASGEHVDVVLTPAGGAVVSLNAGASTCDNAGANTNASGQCTIVFTSNTAGTVTGTASATLSIGGNSVSVSTNSTGDNSAPAVKTFVAGTLKWLKHDGDGNLLGGAVFTVCRTEVWDSDLNAGAGGYTDINPDVCIDVTDNVSGTDNTNAPPADRDGTAGEFEVGGLILGKYTITEKTAPAGYVLDPDTENADLSTGTASVTIATAFVNRAPEAWITIGPNTATNNVGDAHTFTAVMTVDPDGGPAPTIGAITITVTPTPSTPGTTNCSAQVGPDAGGLYSRTCTRQINSTTPGTFTANASGTATIGTLSLTRDTDPATTTIGAGPGGSGPAEKIYVAPELHISKTPDLDTDEGGVVHPGGTASFTITVTNTGSGPANGVELTDTLPAPLTWTEANASCSTSQIVVQTVSRTLLTCNIGTLAALTGSFSVTVTSNVIPESILQLPPSNVGSPIEIEGNLFPDAAGGRDWSNLPSTVFTCVAPRVGCDIDLATGQGDNSFGQGTKEDNPNPTVVSGQIPNNKSDLRRFYVAGERVGTANFLYLAWSRVQEPNGSTNMDIELNHSSDKLANGIPVRSDGDVLVRYDLTRGGTVPVLGFHRWITSGPASNCEASNTVPCWDTLKVLDTDVDADINTVSVPELAVFGGNLSARTFGEASINLIASGIFEAGICETFGQAYLKSRSSDSFTSELKDFILPIPISITNCAPFELNNTAYAQADNFQPAGDTLGGWISDAGNITVTANETASLNVTPSGRELAVSGQWLLGRSFGMEPFARGEPEQSTSTTIADDGIRTTPTMTRGRGFTSRATPMVTRSRFLPGRRNL